MERLARAKEVQYVFEALRFATDFLIHFDGLGLGLDRFILIGVQVVDGLQLSNVANNIIVVILGLFITGLDLVLLFC